MIHHTSSDFWACYNALPKEIQKLADESYEGLKDNPRHPSFRFKKVGALWSVAVGVHYRALAHEVKDGYVWFWIGTHEEYNGLV